MFTQIRTDVSRLPDLLSVAVHFLIIILIKRLRLPKLQDYAPSKNGDSPLEKATDWVNVTVNGKKGKRETSTMPGSAGSSWYFLR